MRTIVLALVAVAFGCGPSPKPQPLSERWSAPTMLSRVPADAPYLIAMLDPAPAAAKQQMFASLDQKVAAAFHASRGVDRSQLEPALRASYAVLDELEGRDLRNWGRELGFDPSGRFVLYGLSVWPVMRVAVADEARVRHVVTRMLTALGVPAKPRSLRGRSYWQLDEKWLSMIGSVVDGEAVFAVMPTRAVPQYLPHVLGLDRPARSLHASGTLNDLLARYRFLPTMVGYIDTRFTADILVGRSSSSNTELDKPLRAELGPVSDACRTDIDRLAGFVPRAVFGYRRLDTKALHATFALELPASAVTALERIRTTMPGMPVGIGQHSLIDFGIAANVDELLALLRRLTGYVQEHPFACPWFAPLGDASAKLAALLDQPLPAALHGVRGLAVVLDHAVEEPFDARGHAVLVADHAHDLLTFALRLLPGLSAVVIHPDARPVQLPLATLGFPESLIGYAATRVDRAAVALGPASATSVVTALNQPAPNKSPLASFGFNAPRMLEIGWLEPEDNDAIEAAVFQLDVTPEGLALEMYATLQAVAR